MPAHDGGGDVACCVEALDGPVVLVDDPRVLIGHQAAARADVTGHDLDRVVRRLVDRAEARMHRAMRVAETSVVRRLATAVLRVDSPGGTFVEELDGLGEPGRVD